MCHPVATAPGSDLRVPTLDALEVRTRSLPLPVLIKRAFRNTDSAR